MNIGLIAMSGVRAYDPDLTRLGVTLPGFVERNRIIASLPSLGLLTLAALTPAKHRVRYLEIEDVRKETTFPEDFDLVAISSYSAQIKEAYELGDWYLQRKIPVVLGGTHVTALPEEAKRHCSSVVIGEGEPLWPHLLEDFERGALQPFYVAVPPGDYDLAEAPIPRYDLLDPDKYNRLTVQTSRGCPHRCDFCASSILLTPKYKLKPIPKVMQEIQAIRAVWDRPFIEFADDNSFCRPAHYRNLLRQMEKEKLRWFTEADISVAKDDELLARMRDSGCKQVLVGLESPCRESLNGIELKGNWKMRQWERYLDAIRKIQSYGITVNGCFILGLDGDTVEVFDQVWEFVQESALYEVQITVMTAFPGTPLYERLKRENRIIKDGAWELCTLFDVNYVPKGMSPDELRAGLVRLAERIYSEEVTRKRRSRFKRMLKTSPNFGQSSKGGSNVAQEH